MGGATPWAGATMLTAASAFRSVLPAAIAPAAMPVCFRNSRRSDMAGFVGENGPTVC